MIIIVVAHRKSHIFFSYVKRGTEFMLCEIPSHNQLWFCLKVNPRINSVRVNCVYELWKLLEASIYSKILPPMVQC